MKSATQFIDFFVHDILDFSVIKKKNSNFTAKNTLFDVQEAINQILSIQEDKVDLKSIKVRTRFIGFDSRHLVKTDKKRF